MEFEVEEDFEAAVAEGLDERVAGGAVELEAYLHPSAGAFELVDEVKGLVGGGEVEGYGEAVCRVLRAQRVFRGFGFGCGA